MPAGIDIIVRSSDSTDTKLIVETKLAVSSLVKLEERLKSSMLRLSCPVGMIVTPEKMWLYADRYLSSNLDSVEEVGQYAIGHLLLYKRGANGNELQDSRRFENIVQAWLESLPRMSTRARLGDAKLWDALNKYVLPALETGDIRAAAPRQ